MKKTVVITGVSTGIGFATAQVLIERGYRVFGSVRKPADGERVQRALGPAFTPLLFDVTDTNALPAAVAQVQVAVGEQGLAALINNAGVAGAGPLMHVPLQEVRQVFDINVFGLLAVTQAFLPLLGARGGATHAPGRIVNLSSISAAAFVFPLGHGVRHVQARGRGLVGWPAPRIVDLRHCRQHAGARRDQDPDLVQGSARRRPPLCRHRLCPGDGGPALKMFAKELKKAKPIQVVTDAICHVRWKRRAERRAMC